jgi:hypothetical protein
MANDGVSAPQLRCVFECRPTPLGTKVSSFLDQILTGVIKNWKGGLPPEIVAKGSERLLLQQDLG